MCVKKKKKLVSVRPTVFWMLSKFRNVNDGDDSYAKLDSLLDTNGSGSSRPNVTIRTSPQSVRKVAILRWTVEIISRCQKSISTTTLGESPTYIIRIFTYNRGFRIIVVDTRAYNL